MQSYLFAFCRLPLEAVEQMGYNDAMLKLKDLNVYDDYLNYIGE